MQRQIYSVLSAGILCIFSIAVSNIRPTITKNNASSKLLDPCQVIVNSPDGASQVAWSPDGKQIVFTTQSNVGDREQRVSIVNADGTNYKLLITYKDETYSYNNQIAGAKLFTLQAPQWLSDNLRIVFRIIVEQRSEPGVLFNDQYVIINSNTLTTDTISVAGSHSILSTGPILGFDLRTTFSISPNDQIFAFFKYGKLNFVSLKNKNNDKLESLPFAFTENKDVSWSPDSRYLTVTDGTLRLIDVNASFNLVDLRLPATGKAVWLRDGSKIAYLNDGIYITDPNGTDSQQVTSYQDKTVVRMDSHLGWLANGTEIGFVSQRTQDTELYAVDVQDHIERQITYGNTINSPLYPVWSVDGKHVVFQVLNTLQIADTSTSCQIVVH